MIFADLFFIYIFLPAFALCTMLAHFADARGGGMRFQNAVLIVFSFVFYAWGEPIYVFLILAGVFVDYICAMTGHERLAVVFHVLSLVVFKYGNLILVTVAQAGGPEPVIDIRLPIGISFYTFQSITYLLDVRRGVCEPQKNPFYLFLYIAMFPQLVAGPIVRYRTIERQIRSRHIRTADLVYGVHRFLTGLAKKVLLANQLADLTAATLDTDPQVMTTGMAWLGIFAFALQIYFDFSGYSDMAIGMGRCMGFRFEENFRQPYLCASVTDFWRRWHISLGTFFRDYVYIPLGGNRVSGTRHIFNIMLVWLLTGFWHGAHWNYLLWGLYYGLLLILEKHTVLKHAQPEDRAMPARIAGHVASLFFVLAGWGIFYFEDFSRMGAFFRNLFFGNVVANDALCAGLFRQNLFLLIVCVIACLPKPRKQLFAAASLPGIIWSVLLLTASTLLLIGATSNPFLYTRF